MKRKNIFLPGIDKQYKLLLQAEDIKPASALILGGNSEVIAERIKDNYNCEVTVIIEEGEDLFRARLNLKERKDINIKQMDFANTDFRNPKFDLIYAQGTISNERRNKIVKEMKRLLLPGGYFLVGEVTALEEETPPFVTEVWRLANITPMNNKLPADYYKERGFDLLKEEDLTYTLKEFYKQASKVITEEAQESEEKKKFFKQAIHEANVYLKLGGDKYVGFKSLLLRKKDE